MFKTILVPIEIAEKNAGSATVKLAQDLASTYGSHLILLNVVEQVSPYVAAQLPPDIHEKSRLNATTRLNEIASEHGIGETAEIVVKDGHPPTEILEVATETNADLIVVASHDPGMADYFLGSVAARVVRHAHCSVLVTRKLEV